MNLMQKSAALAAALTVAVASAAPAFARDYVMDTAGIFSAGTVSALNTKIGDFNTQTHKDVVVYTEPSFTGTPQAEAERIFAQQQVDGVLIFIAKSPKTIGVVPDRAASRFFPSGSTSAIRQAIANGFNAGNFDGGITNGVDLTLNMYRSHLGALRTTSTMPVTTSRSEAGGGMNMGWIWWLIALAVIFFIVRGIFRAMAGPRMMPPGYGGPGYGGPGYGGPGYGGYGPGYGGGMGGGGFFSGLLGGLGGAWLGNELFGGRREEIINDPNQVAGFGGNPGGFGNDAGGFQQDPGQADMGNASFGGWGDSGGGDAGGWGGGGGDFGGGSDQGGGGW